MKNTQLKNYLNKCVRCGQCRSTCPVFEVLREESAAPRGKVFIASLLFSGELSRPGEAGKYLALCLQCRRCSEQCPSGVPVHHIISEARKLASKPWQHIFYNYFLVSTPLRSGATQLFRAAENLGFKELGVRLGILPRWLKNISVPGNTCLPEFTPSREPSRGKITYFPGCTATHIMPGVAAATVDLLAALGWNVVKPRNFTCCGFPHRAAGSDKTKELQEINYNILQNTEPDAIITSCPTCTLALRETLEAKQDNIPVMEATEFLAREGINPKQGGVPPVKAAYHRPCHSPAPASKNLLQELPGVEIVPWELEEACCGGGGIFMFQNPDISARILEPKVNAIKKTGASIIITNCPVCIMQLKRGLGNTGIKVIHAVEILARGLAGQPHKQPQ